jgi:hypothetical protein
MRLFLDNREAFEFAWSRLLVYASPSKLSVYSIPKNDLTVGQQQIEKFRSKAEEWFESLAQGKNCQIKAFHDQN